MPADIVTCKRRPWIAAVLALFCPGLGHLYCGQPVTGLIVFLSAHVLIPVSFIAARLDASERVLLGLLSCIPLTIGVYAFAVVDSWCAARRSGDFMRRSYNRAPAYALCIAFGIISVNFLAMLTKAHAFEAYKFAGGSMEPNLLASDRVLVNKAAYRQQPPRRGDLIAFRPPDNRQQVHLKRVIGLGGDIIAIESGAVIVNHRTLVHENLDPPAVPTRAGTLSTDGDALYEVDGQDRYLILKGHDAGAGFPEATVPEGQCFVLGDNRGRSLDSRHFGFVPLADVLGQPQYIFYPAGSWARFGVVRQ